MTEKPEEKEKPEEGEKETDKPQDKQAEKTLTQSEVNALMAKERKQYETKLKAIGEEYEAYKKQIEEKQAAAEEAAKEKVEKLREGLPEGITNLLDKLTFQDQLEWLSDPANTIEHKTIKPLPEPNAERGRVPSIGTII
jgi:molecular chaperone GrpE (heat shock protein)